MPPVALTTTEIIAAIRRLKLGEQLVVFNALQESLPEQTDVSIHDFEVSEEMHKELQRRLKEYRTDPSTAIEWDDFEKELNDRFGEES